MTYAVELVSAQTGEVFDYAEHADASMAARRESAGDGGVWLVLHGRRAIRYAAGEYDGRFEW